MGRTGLTIRQLENTLFFTLAAALVLAAVAIGGCGSGELTRSSGEWFFKQREAQKY